MKYFLAIDLGASSGRHVVAHQEGDQIILDEVHRFLTGMDQSNDGLVWNIPRLFEEIKAGIKKALEKYPHIESLSIDTWGVDYVLMNGDKELPPFYAYRNERNIKASEEVHKIIPFNELYGYTGIQFAAFNTVYQLFDDLKQGRLEKATDYLMLPSYFTYKLTGVKTHEYTEESTGAFLNASTRDYEYKVIDKLGLPRKLFGKIQQPGFVVGDLLPEVQKEVGGNIKVILCASHDTGSAFESADIDDDTLIISSGTWSLLGIKSKEPICTETSLKANYTNEGGVGYIRFLKNIMGMWLQNQLRNELQLSFKDIDDNINKSTYQGVFDVNDASLVAPKSMKAAIINLLKDNPPQNDIDLFAAIFHSMANTYKIAIDELEEITGRKFKKILILGGGARNIYVNKQVGLYTGKEVIASPVEATCLGNIKVQMEVSK